MQHENIKKKHNLTFICDTSLSLIFTFPFFSQYLSMTIVIIFDIQDVEVRDGDNCKI